MSPTIFRLRKASYGLAASVDGTSSVVAQQGDGLPEDMLVAIDWGTELGTTSAALLDSAKSAAFTASEGGGNSLEVVSSDDLGFPSLNVLKLFASGTAASWKALFFQESDNHFAVPALGASLFYRWYVRMETNAVDNATHLIHAGPSTSISANVWFIGFNISGSNWRPTLFVQNQGTGVSDYNAWATYVGEVIQHPLALGTVYVFELQIERDATDADIFYAKMWVTDTEGVEVLGPEDFNNADFNTGPLETLADDPELHFGDTGGAATSLQELCMGINGFDGNPGGGTTYGYLGCVAIRTAGRCGLYNPAEASF